MSEVVRQLSERLVSWGHEVVVATSKDEKRTGKSINGVVIKEFDISGNLVRGIWGAAKEYEHYLLESQFDVVVFFAAQQWSADLALPILNQIHGKKVFVPTGFSGFYQKEYVYYFEQMKTWLKDFDRAVFLSNDYRDINFARQIHFNKISLIPNGADEREFSREGGSELREKLGIGPDELLIITVGSHTGKKGHKEAIEIFKKIKSDRAVTFIIVGNLPITGTGVQKLVKWGKELVKKVIRYQGGGECRDYCEKQKKVFADQNPNKRLLVQQLSRTETVEAYFAADLFLFPSNIECSPIVLFESAAAGTPFFVTDVGNSKEIVEWTGGGIVLPTDFNQEGLSYARIDESADLLSSYLHEPAKLKSLGSRGRIAWESKFSWEKITRDYESLYNNLISTENVIN